MTTSDSEAYESADEELTGKSPEKPATLNSEIKKCEAIDSKMFVDKQKSSHGVNLQKSEADQKIENTAKGRVGFDSENLKSCKLQDAEGDWENFEIDVSQTHVIHEKQNEDFKDKMFSEGCKENQTNSIKDQADDGWDIDDWGDEEIESHISSKAETIHSEKEFKDLADRLSALGGGDVKSNESQTAWGGWGTWGASLISSGVTQISSHISQGLNTVSSAIDSGIGVVEPEELVKIQNESKLRRDEEMKKSLPKGNTEQNNDESVARKSSDAGEDVQDKASQNSGIFQFGKFVSSVTNIVETTGSTVITGGLDTLQEIGKRTMKVIDDSGGREKLSTLLRETIDRKDEIDTNSADDECKKKDTPSFEMLFDDFQGLVHLEALEMLSKQCDIKLQSLASKCDQSQLTEFNETLEYVKELCELPEYDSDDEGNLHDNESLQREMEEHISTLDIEINSKPLLSCWKKTFEFEFESFELPEGMERNADNIIEFMSDFVIRNMAHFTALSVEIIHKCAALLSVKERRSTVNETSGMTELTTMLSHHVVEIAKVFTNRLNTLPEHASSDDCSEKTSHAMTNIFLEADKGSSFIKNAFNLTIPILQVGAQSCT